MKSRASFIQRLTQCLLLALSAVLISWGAVGCGGGGGVSGGGTGGNLTQVVITPAGGVQKNASALSAGAVTGLGSATYFLGDIAVAQSSERITPADGLPLDVVPGLGVQLAVVATDLTANNTRPITPAQTIAIRASVGVLRVDGLPGVNRYRINGQRILINRFTVLVGTASLDAWADQSVAVAGYLEPLRNDIVATRVERLPAGLDLAGQQVISAQVRSVDAQTQLASLGFAQLKVQNISASTPVQAGQRLNLRVRPAVGQPDVLEAISIQALGPKEGEGSIVLRDVVTSRPTSGSPNQPLIVGGYTVRVTAALQAVLDDVRVGSVVQIAGTQITHAALTIQAQSLALIANPIDPFAGESPAPGASGSADKLQEDYRLVDAVIEQLSADQRSFVLRGLRIRLDESQSALPLANGQRISVAGELVSDGAEQFLRARILP